VQSYLEFVLANRRFVGFGFFVAFASSFGQTYFIGVFGPELRAEFALSHTDWGVIYMVGTLASACVLPWTGKLLDDTDLRTYTGVVGVALACACAFIALVPVGWILVIAIFGLRQTGQGLTSHIAATSMSRYFEAERGRAIAICALGYAAGEAVLPFLADLSIDYFGWRWTYGLAALIHLLVFAPFMLWLLVGHGARHARYQSRLAQQRDKARGVAVAGWTRKQVMRDPRFLWMLPGLMAPSLVLTAMFFHHLNIADAKGWAHAWITGSYVLYAVATVVTSLYAGQLIDRISAVRVVPWVMMPSVVGLVMLALSANAWIAWPYLILIGVSSGVTYTALAALWAELYGTAHLGAIRSLAVAITVLASGLGPVIVGGLLDLGLSVDTVLYCLAAYSLLGGLLIKFGLSREPSLPEA